MSKQLSISATLAVLSMAALALATSFGNVAPRDDAQAVAQAPLVGFEASR